MSHVFSDHGLVSFSILITLARVERKTSNCRITNPDAVHKPQLVEKVNKTIGNLETNTADMAAWEYFKIRVEHEATKMARRRQPSIKLQSVASIIQDFLFNNARLRNHPP